MLWEGYEETEEEMNDEPQCKTRADLHRKWADVLEMCEAAGFDRPCECIKCGSNTCITWPNFGGDPIEYNFAIAIVEGKPVFRGDVLYPNIGAPSKFVVGGILDDGVIYNGSGTWDMKPHLLSWNPPKPATIEINGVKVKAPGEIRSTIDFYYSHPHEVTLRFASMDDAEAFKAALEGKK